MMKLFFQRYLNSNIMRFILVVSLVIFLILQSACTEKEGATDKSNKPAQAEKNSELRGTTVTGYAYEHHIRNNGPKPKEGDMVKYHQIFLKNDSLMLQSSYYFARPFEAVLPPRDTFAKQGMQAPAFYDALFLMSAGDSLVVHMKLDTFAANKLPRGFTNKDKVSYVIKLLSFKGKEQVEVEERAFLAKAKTIKESTLKLIEAYKANKLEGKLKSTPSGLKYILHEEGTGKHPKEGDPVAVHYTGFLLDGTNFDNSYEKMKTFNFRVGKKSVIKGWDEGILFLKPGGTATFFIPPALAYGATPEPQIPANSELVFHVSLERIGY